MGSEHQKFKKGQKELSAKQLNAISRDAEVAGKTRVRGGRQVRMPGVGQSIDTTVAATREVLDFDKSMTVVIKKSPSTNAGWVTVQRVQYIDWPVQPCTDTGCRIQVFGNTIEARPQFGLKTDSYKAFEVGATIDTGTKFFTIRWENKQWILSGMSGGGGVDIAMPFGAVSSSFIAVKRIRTSTGGGFTLVEPAETVRCWPNTDNVFWARFYNLTFDGSALPVLLVEVQGTWYAVPTWALNTFSPSTTLLAGDC